MLLFRYRRVLWRMSYPTIRDTLCELGLSHMSFTTERAYTIMTIDISSIAVKDINPSHLDATGSKKPLEEYKFRY
jgi:hypothetical protein